MENIIAHNTEITVDNNVLQTLYINKYDKEFKLVPEIIELRKQLALESPDKFDFNFKWIEKEYTSLDIPGISIFLLVDKVEDKLIGLANTQHLCEFEEETYFIYNFIIAKKYRSKGICSYFLNKMENMLKNIDKASVLITTTTPNNDLLKREVTISGYKIDYIGYRKILR